MSHVQNGRLVDVRIGGKIERGATNVIAGVHHLALRRNAGVGEAIEIDGLPFVVRKEKTSDAKGIRLFVVEPVG